MINRFIVYLFIVLASAASGAGFWHFSHPNGRPVALGRAVPDFALLDQSGKFHQLSDYRDRKAIVLYSHDPDCPSGKQGMAALESLRQQFGPDSTAILAIEHTTGKSESKSARSDLPVLLDDGQLVAESLGIVRSGEALVVDSSNWTLRYRGPIDDRNDYESENPQISKYYLEDAINAVLNGNTIEIAERAGIGCPIDFGTSNDSDSISYRDSIAPIFQQRCLSCHQKGGIGPWAMDGHAMVKAWTARIREVILLKQMPPWHADPAVGEFAHSLALETREKKALIRWIDAGAPRGEGQDPLQSETPAGPAAWPLGEPDIVLKVPTFEIPAKGILAWQYIKLPVPVGKDTWVRAVHMKPSNREATHHVFAFIEYPKERKQEEPKWAEGANGFFAAYVPGAPVLPFPDDSGRLLPKDSKIIFQRHYLTLGYPTEDNLELGLYLYEDPPSMEYKMATAINLGIRIPPRAAAHRESATVVFPENGNLQAIYPHMHYRGSSIRLSAAYPDGREEALLSVPDYHFQWQTSYQLADPKPMPAGTRIRADAEFDNSAKNPLNPDPDREVRWGQLSENEMLVAYLMYTTPRKPPNLAGTTTRQPVLAGRGSLQEAGIE
ncbi:MAG: redoxin domain-containing protein [Methylococcaceae bacterium]|nr:redoxin domain-containing protein [Methylococcaceae bacterium]MCI0734356.1 redoxin domain-containing protein [Methylococcaceae bacterium]